MFKLSDKIQPLRDRMIALHEYNSVAVWMIDIRSSAIRRK